MQLFEHQFPDGPTISTFVYEMSQIVQSTILCEKLSLLKNIVKVLHKSEQTGVGETSQFRV